MSATPHPPSTLRVGECTLRLRPDGDRATLNRGQLRRYAQAGRLWAQCRYAYTDDYAHDAETHAGREDAPRRVVLEPEVPEGAGRLGLLAAFQSVLPPEAAVWETRMFQSTSGHATARRDPDAPDGWRLAMGSYPGESYTLLVDPPQAPDAAPRWGGDPIVAMAQAAVATWTAWALTLDEATRATMRAATDPGLYATSAVQAPESVLTAWVLAQGARDRFVEAQAAPIARATASHAAAPALILHRGNGRAGR